MTDETWKEVPTSNGYMVSSYGRVKGRNGRILRPYWNAGYLAFDVRRKKPDGTFHRKVEKVHRVVLISFVGFPELGQVACHRNGINTDNRLENLYWGTISQNAKDSIKHGTFYHVSTKQGTGEKSHKSKYSDELIKKVREEYTGEKGQQAALARKHRINRRYLCDVLNGKERIKGSKEGAFH